MATLKRNVIANLAGGAWIAALTLAITPLQINLIGMEAYGLIGFITTLQIVVSVLDLGLSSTITRELAGDNSPGKGASRSLLRTALTFYWVIALFIGFVLLVCAEGIGRAWFNPETVNRVEITQSLQVIAIVLALRWPVSLYSGALAGVQRMDVLNVTKSGTVTLRLVGGILVVLFWRSLDTFLVWTAFSALVEVSVYMVVCRKIMPEMEWRPGFSMSALKAVWGFSLSMNALAVLAMGITQLDRLLISKMLPLQELGYYSLAYNTATSISLILSALSSALMPSLASAYGANDRGTLLSHYHNVNRIMLFGTGLVLFALLFFGEPLLAIWVNPVAAAGAWRPLALLAGGFWLSAAVSGAYNVGVSCRQPGVLLKISALSAIMYAPVLYGLITIWGIEGAATAWLLLNVGYVLTIVPIVHRVILNIPVVPWFTGTLLPFAVLGIVTFGSAHLFENNLSIAHGFGQLMIFPAALAYVGIGYFFLGEIVRADIIRTFRRIFRNL